MEQRILEGTEQQIVHGLGMVVAGLCYGRPGFAEQEIREQLSSNGFYLSQPIMPGPELMLTPQGDGLYLLQVIDGRETNYTGNADKARDLVDKHLAEHFSEDSG